MALFLITRDTNNLQPETAMFRRQTKQPAKHTCGTKPAVMFACMGMVVPVIPIPATGPPIWNNISSHISQEHHKVKYSTLTEVDSVQNSSTLRHDYHQSI